LREPSGGNGSLLSPPTPPTFDLSFQWKIEQKTNSGLKYRVRRFGNQWLGIEYQIIDEPISRENASKGATAAIYDLIAVDSQRKLHPPGQWNQARIVAHRDRLEHYLNGELVSQGRTRGVAWDQAIAFSKFFGLPGFGQPSAGDRIMLTDHGGRVAYRNFRLRPLDDAAEREERQVSSGGPQLANAFRNGWADQTSIVLWSRTTAQADMVKQGPAFVQLSSAEVNELSKSSNEHELVSRQLPSHATLDTMQGACPGAAGEIQLTYFPLLRRHQSKTIPWQTTRAHNGYTIQWHLQDLQPGTAYAGIVEARPVGQSQVTAIVRGTFLTAPAADQSADVRFCLTTCHDYVRRDDGDNGHKIYTAMATIAPDFVVHAGDIEYYDHTSPWAWTVDLMRFKWNRLFALPKNRQFYANTTSYFIKDDHDTLKNDCYLGQRYGAVTFEQGMELFNQEQFPSRQPRYQTVSWGKDIQIWILEGRDFRSPNAMKDGPDKTILGQEQKAWLFQTLERSTATFKLVFTPTPIVGPDRPNKHDNHANENFQYEGDELRAKFASLPGVIVFCGDRHWQYASVDRESGLWEFGCGPGSQVHQLGWKDGDVRPEHQFLRVAGGFLSGRLNSKPAGPTLTVQHHDVTGQKVSEFVFQTKP
jgi:alkaline phosphatase D